MPKLPGSHYYPSKCPFKRTQLVRGGGLGFG